ncbi:MAG: hydrogenase maturation peptidase HycI [Candidatus Methanofastidiosia archaeon]
MCSIRCWGVKNLTKKDFEHVIQKLSKKTLILGVGNSIKGDDGVGPWITKQLEGTFHTIDGMTVPEAYVPDILSLSPNLIIIIDAARMGASPGSIGMFKKEDIKNIMFSTHSMPLSILAKYLENKLGCEVFIIGIEPKDFNFGSPLSKEVQEAASHLVNILSDTHV